MTDEQLRYKKWLETKMPYLLGLFDFDDRAYIPDLVERYISRASQGEEIMCRFAIGVWAGQDQYDFDFVDAAKKLDKANMTIITDWLDDPFWP